MTPPRRDPLGTHRQGAEPIVEDVKTLDADATDDDVRHHLDRLQRAINREYNSGGGARGLLPRAHGFARAARQVKTAHGASAVPHGIDASQGLHDARGQRTAVATESGRPRSSRREPADARVQVGAATPRQRRAKSNRTNRGPNEIAVDRAQLACGARRGDRAGECTTRRRGHPPGAEGAARGARDVGLRDAGRFRGGATRVRATGIASTFQDGGAGRARGRFFSRRRRQRRRRGRGRV